MSGVDDENGGSLDSAKRLSRRWAPRHSASGICCTSCTVRCETLFISAPASFTASIDDIESRVYLAIFTRLRNSGPLDKRLGRFESYLWTVTRREAAEYLRELAERAEEFVGDATHKLDGEGGRAVHPGPEENLAVLIPAMQVLREELSDLQLKVFVLAEGYGLKSPYIAELLGGTTTKSSVRDALRHARSKLSTAQVGSRLRVLAED